ncbi:hypothetical protein ISX56_31395, partial [Serratia ureilytica]|nr:hypothetical protein [Serratia ureilytica]
MSLPVTWCISRVTPPPAFTAAPISKAASTRSCSTTFRRESARRGLAAALRVARSGLMDADIISQRIAQLRHFDTIRFAQKACSNIHILRLMREQGVKVDSVSLGEIER